MAGYQVLFEKVIDQTFGLKIFRSRGFNRKLVKILNKHTVLTLCYVIEQDICNTPGLDSPTRGLRKELV